jgi:hypothetical protein
MAKPAEQNEKVMENVDNSSEIFTLVPSTSSGTSKPAESNEEKLIENVDMATNRKNNYE